MTGGRAFIRGCCCAGLAALAAGCGSQTVLGSDAGSDAAPWVPPVADAGDPGWRDSTEPWPGPPYVPDCEHVDRQQFAVDVLAQPEGLYALAMWVESRRDGGGWVDLGRYLGIDFNDGGGWRDWDDRVCSEFGPGATCPRRLLGLVGGRAAGSVAEFLGPDIPLLVLLSPGTREAPGDAAPWLEPIRDRLVVMSRTYAALWRSA